MQKERPLDKLEAGGEGQGAFASRNNLAIVRNPCHMIVQRSMADRSAATTGSVIFPPDSGAGRAGSALCPQEAPFHAGRFEPAAVRRPFDANGRDRKSTRLNSSH